jgi:hypothetical protein
VRVALQDARAALDLDQKKATGREDEHVHFVDAALIGDELEVRPGVVGLLVGEAFADEIERVLFPGVGRLGDRVPAGQGKWHRVEIWSLRAHHVPEQVLEVAPAGFGTVWRRFAGVHERTAVNLPKHAHVDIRRQAGAGGRWSGPDFWRRHRRQAGE